jgi:hypothetical protein
VEVDDRSTKEHNFNCLYKDTLNFCQKGFCQNKLKIEARRCDERKSQHGRRQSELHSVHTHTSHRRLAASSLSQCFSARQSVARGFLSASSCCCVCTRMRTIDFAAFLWALRVEAPLNALFTVDVTTFRSAEGQCASAFMSRNVFL